uniref:Neur_chan_LBD domain-containing protein n=1 Tax=Macrostomum lignano TaxID=282301 RepID=A0A1I8FSN2_9PLAT
PRSSALPMFTIAVAASEAADDAGGRNRHLDKTLKNLIKALLSEYDKKSRPVIDDDPADGGDTENRSAQGERQKMLPRSRFNNADERLEERREVAAKVHSNGTVEWHPMAIYKSACEIRIEYFPFDVQTCDLKFGPWTYDGWRVNITYYHRTMKSAFDLDEMIPSPEWKILNYSAVYNSVVYPCCPEPFVDITFRIYMKRSTLFYSFILILPCFLLSSLTLVLFWLPPETPAKNGAR